MDKKIVGGISVMESGLEIEWEIPKFFNWMNTGDEIRSRSFSFCGATWYITLLPSGYGDKSEDYISVFLGREYSGVPKTLTYSFHFKAADGEFIHLFKDTHTLPDEEGNVEYGIYNAFEKSGLLQNRSVLAPSGLLTVVCFLGTNPEIIEQPKKAEVSTQTQSNSCIEKLSHDLSELLMNENESDLTLRVKDKEFRLHRNIMGARTPVFSCMLRHEMKERTTGVVCIDDCDVPPFQEFVSYIYSGRVDTLSTDTVFDLFALAEKYQVDELKSICLEFVQRTVSVDTFCDVVTLALTYDKKELLKQATEFLAENMTGVMETVKWMNFMKEHHIEANELLLKAVRMKML